MWIHAFNPDEKPVFSIEVDKDKKAALDVIVNYDGPPMRYWVVSGEIGINDFSEWVEGVVFYRIPVHFEFFYLNESIANGIRSVIVLPDVAGVFDVPAYDIKRYQISEMAASEARSSIDTLINVIVNYTDIMENTLSVMGVRERIAAIGEMEIVISALSDKLKDIIQKEE